MKAHLASVYNKLGVDSRAAAIALASKAGEDGYGPFWAGTGCAEARPGTAAEILRRLAP